MNFFDIQLEPTGSYLVLAQIWQNSLKKKYLHYYCSVKFCFCMKSPNKTQENVSFWEL